MKQATKTCSKKIYIKHETQYIIIWPFMGIIHNVERQPKKEISYGQFLSTRTKREYFNIQHTTKHKNCILNIDFISHHQRKENL